MTSTTRRAALGALAGASALALPAVAIAATSSPDAGLLALQPEIEAMDQCKKTACDLHSAAEHAYGETRPPKPVRAQSKPLWSELGYATEAEYEEHSQRGYAESLAIWSKMPSDPHEAAVQAWKQDCERLKVECGVDAAKERVDQAYDRENAVRDRIADIRATTLAGLQFKARYAVAHNEDEPDPAVVESILADLMAMSAKEARA